MATVMVHGGYTLDLALLEEIAALVCTLHGSPPGTLWLCLGPPGTSPERHSPGSGAAMLYAVCALASELMAGPWRLGVHACGEMGPLGVALVLAGAWAACDPASSLNTQA